MLPIDINLANKIIEDIGDGIIILDVNYKIKYVNNVLLKNLGYKKIDVENKSFNEIFCRDKYDDDIILKYLKNKNKKTSARYDGELVKKDNECISIEFYLKGYCEDEEYKGLIMFISDISYRIHVENKLKELTMKDGLTDLYNQKYFYEVLDMEIEIANRYNRGLSLLYIDFDNFKQCNDTFGHLFGDKVLKYCSDIIKNTLRKSDTMFRYGGDEFIILLPQTRVEKALIVAQKLIDIFDFKMDLAFNFGDIKPIRLSIGIVEYKLGEEKEHFVQRADKQMYNSKRKTGSSFSVDEGM